MGIFTPALTVFILKELAEATIAGQREGYAIPVIFAQRVRNLLKIRRLGFRADPRVRKAMKRYELSVGAGLPTVGAASILDTVYHRINTRSRRNRVSAVGRVNSRLIVSRSEFSTHCSSFLRQTDGNLRPILACGERGHPARILENRKSNGPTPRQRELA